MTGEYTSHWSPLTTEGVFNAVYENFLAARASEPSEEYEKDVRFRFQRWLATEHDKAYAEGTDEGSKK